MGAPFENRTRFQTKMGKVDIRSQNKQGGKTIPFRACGTYLNGLYRGTPRSPQNPVGVTDPHPWLLY